MNWDDLMFEKKYSSWKAYSQSKLANILFTRELANRLKGTNVTAYVLHPGAVRTELQRHVPTTYGFLLNVMMFIGYPLFCILFKTPFEGAQTNIYCAVAEELDNVSGHYYSDCKEKKLLPHALIEGDPEKLWKISEKLVNL